jgi:hypothetical protein
MDYSVGDILWADIPYNSGEGGKIRPVVVIGILEGSLFVVDVLEITSKHDQEKDYHKFHHLEIEEYTSAGLPKKSDY